MKIKEAEVRCQLHVTSHQTTLQAEAAQKKRCRRIMGGGGRRMKNSLEGSQNLGELSY